jgi:hypothetical protein
MVRIGRVSKLGQCVTQPALGPGKVLEQLVYAQLGVRAPMAVCQQGCPFMEVADLTEQVPGILVLHHPTQAVQGNYGWV